MRMAEPAEHHVLLRQRHFHYLDWEGPGEVPIVFLHGSGLAAWTWSLVCLALQDRYRCYALDLRGHGDSEWAADMDYSPEAHAGDVKALVDHLGLDRPVIVGMSLGGLVGARYAIDRDVRALVVIDTGPRIEPAGREHLLSFLREPAELDSLEAFVDRAIAFNPRRDRATLRVSLLRNLVRLPDGKWTWKYDRRHHGRVPESEREASRAAVWRAADRIRCPVLIVRGSESRVVTRESAEALAASMPRGKFAEIPDAGHAVHSDQPRALVAALTAFLDASVGPDAPDQ
jgi:pimeloyl-ACP methyl ester carboxylesterase